MPTYTDVLSGPTSPVPPPPSAVCTDPLYASRSGNQNVPHNTFTRFVAAPALFPRRQRFQLARRGESLQYATLAAAWGTCRNRISSSFSRHCEYSGGRILECIVDFDSRPVQTQPPRQALRPSSHGMTGTIMYDETQRKQRHPRLRAILVDLDISPRRAVWHKTKKDVVWGHR